MIAHLKYESTYMADLHQEKVVLYSIINMSYILLYSDKVSLLCIVFCYYINKKIFEKFLEINSDSTISTLLLREILPIMLALSQ